MASYKMVKYSDSDKDDWTKIAGFNFIDYPKDDMEDFFQDLINDRVKKKSVPKRAENHLGEIEDVEQPLILDPSLDF